MAAGYSVAHAPRNIVTLSTGRRCGRDFLAMLRAVEAVVGANEGVALAPRRGFPASTEAGTLTTITDASGVDGVGGYAFLADLPGDVFVMSALWPPDVQRAIDRCQARAERSSDRGAKCPMPAAELFGCAAMAAAVATLAPIKAIIAVTDCEPAAKATNAACSTSPVMQAIIRGARATTTQWLGVHVRRELNQDADRLSHPEEADEVIREARAAGLRVTRLADQDVDWAPLRDAIEAAAEGWEWRSTLRA
jgi:hypothetical protein